MTYTVHIYATVRIPVKVEAGSQKDAMEQATTHFLAPTRYWPGDVDLTKADYADEITAYLVDEEGDEEYANTRNYDGNMEEEVQP